MNCLRWLYLCGVVLLGGCGVLGANQEPSLDPVSEEMVVALREPVVYVRNEPGLSRTARDYLYLGPVEGNVAGDQRFYLWVGIAGTIDRAFAQVADLPAYALFLKADGYQLELPLSDWHDDLEQSPYNVRVPLRHSMRAALTTAQLERVAAAEGVALTVVAADGRERDFEPFSGDWSQWRSVADDAAIGFGVQVRSSSELADP